MTEKNNYSQLFRLLAGENQPPLVNSPGLMRQMPEQGAVPPASLSAVVRALVGPPKSRPPEMSVTHMKELVEESFKKKLDVNPGRQLPTIYDLAIGEGRQLNAAFVYTDLVGYSKLVSGQGTGPAFHLLQTFVNLIEKITSHFKGVVVDCAGDRTLSVFYRPHTDNSRGPIREAVTAALWIQTAMLKVVSPRYAFLQIPDVKASVGIDYGSVIAGCVGVRGNKRLVFFGDAANQAAKLQEEGSGGQTVMSPIVFQNKPSYLDNGTWLIETKVNFNNKVSYFYVVNQHFSDDIPPASDTYLK